MEPSLLSLPLEHGTLGREHAELAWYFTEGRAAQAGLRSNQGMVEARLECGGKMPMRPSSFDARLVKHIHRARQIERKLEKIPNDLAARLIEVHDPETSKGMQLFGIAGGLARRTATAKRESKVKGSQRQYVEMMAYRISCGHKAKSREKNIIRRIAAEAQVLYAEALKVYRETA